MFLATVLVANNIIGSGVFLLPATLAALGGITIFGWLIAAAGAVLVAHMLGRLAEIVPDAGGPCAYPAQTLGRYAGFQATSAYWVGCWVGNIAVAVAGVGYLSVFFPILAQPLPAAVAVCGLIWVVTFINIIGPQFVCRMDAVTLVAGLVPLLITAAGAWTIFDPHIYRASWNVSGAPPIDVIPQSLVLVFWAFVGLESAAVSPAVVKDPARNVGRAGRNGVAVAALVYIAACNVIFGLIPAEALAMSNSPFADAVGLFLGPVAMQLVAALAFVKATGTLAGLILVTAQVGKSAALVGHFPKVMMASNRDNVPVTNLLGMAVLMSGVVFATLSPTLGAQFAKLIDVSVVLTLVVYIYAAVSVFLYPDPRLKTVRPAAAAVIALCAVVVGQSNPAMLELAVGILLLTGPIYLLRRYQTKAD